MTATALALASRPWLIQRGNIFVVAALFAGWVSVGFMLGWASARPHLDQRASWVVAAATAIGNGTMFYSWRMAAGFLQSPHNFNPILPPVSLLLFVDEMHGFAVFAVAATGAAFAAAWFKKGRLLAFSVAMSLLNWFVVFWIAFMWTAAASLSLN
jgi:hypothetical protein